MIGEIRVRNECAELKWVREVPTELRESPSGDVVMEEAASSAVGALAK